MLTTKLASMKYYGNCLISFAKPLNSTSAIYAYRIQSVAAPRGWDLGNVPPEHKLF